MEAVAKFISSYDFTLIVLLPAIVDFFVGQKEWYLNMGFMPQVMFSAVVGFTTLLILGIFNGYAGSCKEDKGFGDRLAYAASLGKTTTILNFVVSIVTLPILGVFKLMPGVGYFVSGIQLYISYILTAFFGGMFGTVKC